MSPADRWQAPSEADGERLDRYLAEHYDVPRNRVQQWIREGLVRVDGSPGRASLRVSEGASLECEPRPIQQPEELQPEEGPLAVLYEDADLAVVDKPPGLVVHPGAGRERGTLVHRLLARYPEIARVGGAGRPGVVHRLDRDTTGLLVVARTERAYQALSTAFAERWIEKTYLALAYGGLEPAEGRFEAPIARHPRRRKEMAVVPGGRPARTTYRTLANRSGISLLRIGLETGRTHQIRVHLKAAGHPLIGDPVYGEARWRAFSGPYRALLERFPRPALHAWRLSFEHPGGGRRIAVEAPAPEDLRSLWAGVTDSPWPELPPLEDPASRSES